MKFHWWLHCWAHILSSVDKDTTEQLEAFTKSFFEEMKTSSYLFFVDEGKVTKTVSQRHPLKVLYPRGRTGQTPHDPRQAHGSFHYSKPGNPVWRLVLAVSLRYERA